MSNRDLRLDSLRGILIVIMTINHLGGVLSRISSEPLGFVSAAEGFILLSGYIYSFTSMRRIDSPLTLIYQALKRAGRIYKQHVLLLLALLVLAALVPTYADYLAKNYSGATGSFWATLVNGLLLIYQPALMDILPMYIVFSVLSPFALVAFSRKQEGFVALASLACWFAGQFVDPLEWFAFATGHGSISYYFNLFSWQLLWITGLYIGYAHGARNNRTILFSPVHFWSAAAVCLAFFLVKHQFFTISSHVRFLLAKPDLRPLRVLNVGCQIIVFSALIRRFDRSRGIPWFQFLGKYSLQAFSFHILLIYVLKPIAWRVEPAFGSVVDVGFSLLVVGSLPLLVNLFLRCKRKYSFLGLPDREILAGQSGSEAGFQRKREEKGSTSPVQPA